MRPFGIFLRDAGKIVARGMDVEGIIDDVRTGRVSRNAEACILGELAFRDRIPTETDRWAPLSHLANLHWMIISTISPEKMELLKSLNGAGDETNLARDKSDGARRLRQTAACKPLLDVATPELFRTNAFRITGLRVDATTREIAKHTDKLKMMEELGQGKSVHTGAFALKTPPSVDQIREAIQRLKEPEQRIIDEFFWFWPRQFGQSASDPAILALEAGDADTALEIWEALETDPNEGVVAIHNIAVLWHCMALEWERHYAKADEFTKDQRAEVDSLWRGSFKRWEILAVDDLFWAKVSARITDLDDPRLTAGFARRMRGTLPQALDRINAELAVQYAEIGNMVSARVHVAFMRESNTGLDNIAATVELVLAPATARLKQQVERAKEGVRKNISETAVVVRELLKSARETLGIFAIFLGKESDREREISDEIASVCSQLPIAYHKATGDNQGCIDLLKLVMPFANSSDTRDPIEKNLEILANNLAFKRLEPIHKLLKAVQDSVSLPIGRLEQFKSKVENAMSQASAGIIGTEAYNELCDGAAIVLREIGLAAWNDHRDLQTALLANARASIYAKDAQLRTRLSADAKILRDMELQLAEEKAAREKEEKATQIRWGIGIGIIAIIALINNCEGSRKTSQKDPSSSGYYSQVTTPPPAPSVPLNPKASFGGTRKQTAEEFLDEKPRVSPTPTAKPSFAPNVRSPAAPKIDMQSESAQEAQRKAVAMYPELAVSSSPLNKLFVAKVNRMKADAPTSFNDPDWAIKVAHECKKEIEGKSTYLVPDSRTLELNLDRSQIDIAKSALSSMSRRIDDLNSELDIARAGLDRTNQYAVESFNRKLDGYNALIEQFKTQQDSVNRLVEAYNEKLHRYGR